MRRFSRKRKIRNSLRYRAMGKRSQQVRREKRESEITPEFLMDLRANPPLESGDPIGCLQYTNFLTGKVTRWTKLRGSRVNNCVFRTPDGRTSKPHGMSWIMEKLRPILLRV